MGRYAQKAATAEGESRAATLAAIQREVEAAPADLTEEEKAAAYTARVGGLDEQFAQVEDQLLRHQAATGAEAGYPESMLELGRIREREKAKGAAELKIALADIPFQRRMARAGAYGNVFGAQSGTYGSLVGSANTPSSPYLTAAISAGGEAAGAYFGSKG